MPVNLDGRRHRQTENYQSE
jgi:hypothetical protein